MTGPRKPWLRLWDRSLDLPKAQRLTGDQFKAWINLLMLANRQNEDGRLPGPDDIAFALRLTTEEVGGILSVLISAKLVDKRGSALSMHDWESWQPAEKTSAQRSAEWRENQKTQALGERSESAQENVGERSSLAGASRADAQSGATSIVCNGISNGINAPPTPRRRGKAAEPPFELPVSIDGNDWMDYEAMRRSIRKPMSDRARHLAVKKLEELRQLGHAPSAVLQQSILNSWQGLFPVSGPKPGDKPGPNVKLAVVDTRSREQLDEEERNYQRIIESRKAKT